MEKCEGKFLNKNILSIKITLINTTKFNKMGGLQLAMEKCEGKFLNKNILSIKITLINKPSLIKWSN